MRFARPLTLLFLVSLAALMMLSACMVTDDIEPESPFKGESGGEEPSTAGTISGRVVDGNGNGNGFVTVQAGDVSAFADGQGDFTLRDIPEDVTFLRVRDDLLRNSINYRPVDVVLGRVVYFPDIALLDLAIRGTVNGADGGEVSLDANGTSVTFGGGTLENAGGPFTGVCGVLMGATLPGDAAFLDAFPGAMEGVRTDGSVVPFVSQGVLWVNLIFANEGLWLADGQTATMSLGLPAEQAATAPATILAWQMVDSTGTWEEIGESTLTDGVYSIDVPRLAPVCWSAPIDAPCELSGSVADQNGNPLASARVIARGLGGGVRSATITDETGAFTLTTVLDVDTELRAYSDNIAGAPDTLAAGTPCPVVLDAPLTVSLPDWSVQLTWTESGLDMDAHLFIADGSWHLNYIDPGTMDGAPFTMLQNDDRDGSTGETVVGQRWYDGTTEFWVHDYGHQSSELALTSGAMVALVIADSTWTFDVSEVPFPLFIDEGDTTVADSTGWWHVFDIEVEGQDIDVVPVERFEDPAGAGRSKSALPAKLNH